MAQTTKREKVICEERFAVKYETKSFLWFKYQVKVKSISLDRSIHIYSGEDKITEVFLDGKFIYSSLKYPQ